MYSAGSSNDINYLTVKDANQKVRDSLVEALNVAVRTNPATRSIEPLCSLLQHTDALNQKELIGLFKAVSSSVKVVGKTTQTLFSSRP